MANKTIASDGYVEQLISNSILCDGTEVDKIVEEFGKPVVVRVVTKSYDANDAYHKAIESPEDHRVKAVVQIYTASDDEVKEGVFKAGEIIFTFKQSDEQYIITNEKNKVSRILYSDEWYEVKEVIKQPMVDVLYYLQVRVQKV